MAKSQIVRYSKNEKRVLNRIVITPDTGFWVSMFWGGHSSQCELVDISPVGVSVVCPEDFDRQRIQRTDFSVKIFYGRRVLAELVQPPIVREQKGGRVIVFGTRSDSRNISREKARATAHSSIAPIIMCPSPLGGSEVLHFRVENFNSSGFLITTSLRNKFLLPGMKFDFAQLLIPGLKIYEISFVIKHTSVSEGRIHAGVSLLTDSSELLQALAQFSMFGASTSRINDPVTPLALKEFGLSPKKIGQGFRIGRIESPADYDEVLRIRFTAYSQAGKVKSESHEDMSDEFDEHSIILAARAGGRIVATVRLVYSNGSQKLPFEKLLKFPFDLNFKRENVYEVSRLSILPDFQGTDLVISLFRAVAKEVTVSKKAALCMATNELRQLYVKLGAEKISREIPHPVLKHETMALFVLKTERFLSGKGMPVLAWDAVAKDVLNDLVYFGFRKKSRFNPRRAFMRNIEKMVLAFRKKKKK